MTPPESTAALGRRQPCHCGSGRKYKNCCYAKDAANTSKAPLSATKVAGTPIGQTTRIETSKFGIPGQEANILITYTYEDGHESAKEGSKGEYDVVFYFRKPGELFDDSNISLDIEQHVGTSLLGIANPAVKFNDPKFDGQETKIKLYVNTADGDKAEAFGTPNKDGYLSDLRVTLAADSIEDAGKRAKLLLVPSISALSFASDIPLHISHTVVREKATAGVTQRDIIVPFPAAATTVQPHAQVPEARVLFNRYRDGINSEDQNWRFLCFASIVEQLWKKTKADKSADLENIVIPKDDKGLIAWFKTGYPKSYAIENQVCLDAVPVEARGMTTNDVIKTYIKPVRHLIAHSLLEDGALPTDQDDVKHRAEVRKWAPVLRCITRIHLQAVYKLPSV